MPRPAPERLPVQISLLVHYIPLYSIFSIQFFLGWGSVDGWGGAVGWATHHSLSQSETVRVREAAADRARCSRPRSRMRMRRPAVSTTLLHVRRWKPRSLSPVHPGSADTSPSPSPKVPGPRFSDPAPASRRGVCAPRPSSAAVLAERTTAIEAACSSPERDCPRPRLSPRHTLAPDADTTSAVARARASRCCALDLWQDAMCLQTSW